MTLHPFTQLEGKNYSVGVTRNIPRHSEIINLLTQNNIPFWHAGRPNQNTQNGLAMGFSMECSFQDVYVFATILQHYGLEYIFPMEPGIEPEVYLRIKITNAKLSKEEALYVQYAYPISIKEFLQIPSTSKMDAVLEEHFLEIDKSESDSPNYDAWRELGQETERDWDEQTDGHWYWNID